MAFCYDKSLQTQKAIAGYKNAIRYNVATPEDRLAYARLLLKNGEYKNAAQEFKIVLDSLPNNQLAKNGLLAAIDAPGIKELGSHTQ